MRTAQSGIRLEQAQSGRWLASAKMLCSLRRCGLLERCLRLLIEPAQESGDPQALFHAIEAALVGVQVQRLLHGFEAAAWAFIELAARRGYDTRVGLGDTLVLPDGTRAQDNAELVAAARQIVRQRKP